MELREYLGFTVNFLPEFDVGLPQEPGAPALQTSAQSVQRVVQFVFDDLVIGPELNGDLRRRPSEIVCPVDHGAVPVWQLGQSVPDLVRIRVDVDRDLPLGPGCIAPINAVVASPAGHRRPPKCILAGSAPAAQ
jgi:hypothetical protein